MDTAELSRLADGNAADAARLFATHEPGATVTERDGTLLVAAALPVSTLFHSAARRIDPQADPHAVLAAVADFGREHERDIVLWVSASADMDIVKAATEAGIENRFSLAGMAIQAPPTVEAPGPGIDLVKVTDAAGAADFARVHGELYEEGGGRFEAAAHFASPAVLLSPNVAGYVAYLEGRPASCAMIVHSDRVAGLFEVATSTAARRRGLGELVSRAATRAGFELGAQAVTLQATALGEPVYRRLGFEKITEYGPCRVVLAR